MAVKLKGAPASIKALLSGAPHGAGAQVNGGEAPSRETRNKVRVDQSPSAVPRRRSTGARIARRSSAITSEPQSFGQNYGM